MFKRLRQSNSQNFFLSSFKEIEIEILGGLFAFLAELEGSYLGILKYFYSFVLSVLDSFWSRFYLFSRWDGFGENLVCFKAEPFRLFDGECIGEQLPSCLIFCKPTFALYIIDILILNFLFSLFYESLYLNILEQNQVVKQH